MDISKKAVVILVPSLLFGIGAPAWSGTEQGATIDAQVMPAGQHGNSLLSLIGSILTATDTSPRPAKDQCKPSQLYSQHDVVGDPEACFMGRYTLGTGSTSAVSVP